MNLYICPRCKYSSNQKNDMRRHFLKKNQCPNNCANLSREECLASLLNCSKNRDCEMTENDCVKEFFDCEMTENDCERLRNDCEPQSRNFGCPYCKKSFTRKNNMNVHIKNSCKEYKFYQENQDVINLMKTLKKEIDTLRNERLDFLQNGVTKNIKTTNNNCNNTNNSNNKIQNNIYINALGKENIDYITKEYILGIVKDGPYGCIQKLIKQIHFNPNHKENQNIRIPNKRDKFALVYLIKQKILHSKILCFMGVVLKTELGNPRFPILL